MKKIVRYKLDNESLNDDENQMIRDIGLVKVAIACGVQKSHLSEYLRGKRTIAGEKYDLIMEYIFKNWKPEKNNSKLNK